MDDKKILYADFSGRASRSPEEIARLEELGRESGLSDSDMVFSLSTFAQGQLGEEFAERMMNVQKGYIVDLAQKEGKSPQAIIEENKQTFVNPRRFH